VNAVVGVVGYLFRSSFNVANLMDSMLGECASPYVENEVAKVALNHGKALGLVVPRGRALYDVAYDSADERGVIIYGYVIVGDRRLMAKNVIEMSEEELYRTLKEADGSFLIVKLEKDRVWIATDWLGTRPLYYAVISNGIVFSSCFWSILRFFKEINYPIKLDDVAILSYLWLGRIGVIGNRTFIEGVYLAPPGTIITYDLKSRSIQFHRYYQLQYKAEIRNKKLAADLVYYALLKSFKQILDILPKEMKDDMCALLSGGIDSRVTTYILKQYVNNLKALTFGTEKCDEIAIAKRVAKDLRTNHVVKRYDLNQLADYTYETIRLSNSFSVVSTAHAGIVIRMLLENACKVSIVGFALDLTLGGSYLTSFLKTVRNYNEFFTYVLDKSSVLSFEEVSMYLGPRLKQKLRACFMNFKEIVRSYSIYGDNYLNRNDIIFLYTRVRRWTLNGTIIDMCVAEEILPTISRLIMELVAKVDPDLRINHKIYRKILLKLNRKLAIILYNKTWLPPILPTGLWKVGFVFKKINNFIKRISNGRLGLDITYFDFDEALRLKAWRALLYETLLDRKALVYKFGYLKYKPVRNIVVEHLSRKKTHGEKLAYMISLELILREIVKYVSSI